MNPPKHLSQHHYHPTAQRMKMGARYVCPGRLFKSRASGLHIENQTCMNRSLQKYPSYPCLPFNIYFFFPLHRMAGKLYRNTSVYKSLKPWKWEMLRRESRVSTKDLVLCENGLSFPWQFLCPWAEILECLPHSIALLASVSNTRWSPISYSFSTKPTHSAFLILLDISSKFQYTVVVQVKILGTGLSFLPSPPK